jgi:hypothetical protein
MPKVIVISSPGELDTCLVTLDRIKKRLPQMTRVGMMRFGKILERDMKISARHSGIKKFTGESQDKGIRYEQNERSDVGFLFMKLYMIYLDSMRPHYVTISLRRKRILDWAKQSVSVDLRAKARLVERRKIKKFSIFVTPHPFIRMGYASARPKLNPILKTEIQRGLKNA